ncbi:lysoplasmalogenase family protein [Flavobacterium enshiense]|uniref:lysoplasmalogenase family protein n=1 Tax=Flavobacterium enshiense TaxID=1341165 RepID=UPI00345CE8AC
MSGKPALILYFTVIVLFMISIVFKIDELSLLTKPVIIPSIFFYYTQKNEGKMNWYYLLIVLIFFIGDMIVLVDLENSFRVIVPMFIVSYGLFLKALIEDSMKIRLSEIKSPHLFALLLCLFLLLYLFISSLDLLMEIQEGTVWLLIIYGTVLLLVGLVSSLNYIINPTRLSFLMILTSLCFVISDVFFVLKKYFLEAEMLDYISNLAQALSYFFLTRYFLLKSVSKNILNDDAAS